MVCINRSLPRMTLAVAFTLGFVINVSAGVHAQLRPSSPSRIIPNTWEFQPPKRGTPGGREGGATRGGCLELTALVQKSGVGLTIAPYPTFLWSISLSKEESSQKSRSQLEFVLEDESGEEVYKTTFAPKDNQGIVSLDLPAFANLPPLETGKEYHWIVTPICNSSYLSQNAVQGWIKRVEPTPEFTRQLQQATPTERLALYANERLWYETVSSLAEMRRAQPNNPTLVDAWVRLLNLAGLNKIVQAPLIQGSEAQTASGNSTINN